jgi:hypothetical protein
VEQLLGKNDKTKKKKPASVGAPLALASPAAGKPLPGIIGKAPLPSVSSSSNLGIADSPKPQSGVADSSSNLSVGATPASASTSKSMSKIMTAKSNSNVGAVDIDPETSASNEQIPRQGLHATSDSATSVRKNGSRYALFPLCYFFYSRLLNVILFVYVIPLLIASVYVWLLHQVGKQNRFGNDAL